MRFARLACQLRFIKERGMGMSTTLLVLSISALGLLAARPAACFTQASPPADSKPHLVRPTAAAPEVLVAEKSGYTKEALADEVTELPGWDKLDFSLFSGYITVNQSAGRALFYALAESPQDSRSKPLTLWLNGGPGCSSLSGGFMSELGPFYPTPGGKLQANPYSWTAASNIIFLESPAFVGWSYSNSSADLIVGDERTADDALQFLLGFFERFPVYANRPFTIAGESYGGHYVPNLALTIAEYNEAKQGPPINLKGFMVGNAWTDAIEDNMGAVDFWHSHALISDDTRDGLMRTCNFSSVGPLQRGAQVEESGKTCDQYVEDSQSESGFADGSVNIYDIFADVCEPASVTADSRQFARVLGGSRAQAATEAGNSDGLGLALSASVALPSVTLPIPGRYDPCIDSEVTKYFNRPDVQRAMHANQTGNALPYAWQGCSDIITYSRADLLSSMLPKYRELLARDMHILVYSGDVDAIVPVTGTRRWIRSLDLPILTTWRPWESATGQVGGYWEQHQGLLLVTVRDAGHMVPYTQPERASYLFKRWLAYNAAQPQAATRESFVLLR